MCGIAGCVGSRNNLDTRVRAMGAAVAHRGPDSNGSYIHESLPVGLAHRRLAILDLTDEGHQPMVSQSGRYVVSYNGELYNYRELAADLGQPGLASDTAVLLACVERLGLAASLVRFNGMFAFALLDCAEAVVHLVRDRLGEKPLYYRDGFDGLTFGSELRAIESGCANALEVDPHAVEELLRFKCIGGNRTIYRGVHKLLPGHHMSVDAKSGRLRSVEPFWSPPHPFDAASSPSSTEDLDAALSESVRLRLRADVPVGTLLSGGVDSGLVTALAAAHTGDLQTFTAGVGDAHYDERAPARAVAAALGTRHHEIELAESDLIELVTQLPSAYDEPFADSSAIPTLALARFVRSNVKVVLTGDGGDELFGGYPRYRLAPQTWRLARRLPPRLVADRAALMEALLSRFGRWSPRFPRAMRERSMGWVAGLLASSSSASSFAGHYRNVRSDIHEPSDLLHPHWRSAIESEPLRASQDDSRDEWLAMMMRGDLLSYLPDDILVKVDRAAMSVGLETRVPLLDPAVLDVAWRMPRAVGVGAAGHKTALRQLLARHLPNVEIPQEKRGFGIPLATWLRGPLRVWAEELLAPHTVSEIGYFDHTAVSSLWQRLQNGQNVQHPLWAVLMLHSWTVHRTGTRRRG